MARFDAVGPPLVNHHDLVLACIAHRTAINRDDARAHGLGRYVRHDVLPARLGAGKQAVAGAHLLQGVAQLQRGRNHYAGLFVVAACGLGPLGAKQVGVAHQLRLQT